jgi:hypothetical protein
MQPELSKLTTLIPDPFELVSMETGLCTTPPAANLISAKAHFHRDELGGGVSELIRDPVRREVVSCNTTAYSILSKSVSIRGSPSLESNFRRLALSPSASPHIGNW